MRRFAYSILAYLTANAVGLILAIILLDGFSVGLERSTGAVGPYADQDFNEILSSNDGRNKPCDHLSWLMGYLDLGERHKHWGIGKLACSHLAPMDRQSNCECSAADLCIQALTRGQKLKRY